MNAITDTILLLYICSLKMGSVCSSAVFHMYTFSVFCYWKPCFLVNMVTFSLCPCPCFYLLHLKISNCISHSLYQYVKCIIKTILTVGFVSNSAEYQIESHYYYYYYCCYLHSVIKEQRIVFKMRPPVTLCIVHLY
jgi:hypothetical protein